MARRKRWVMLSTVAVMSGIAWWCVAAFSAPKIDFGAEFTRLATEGQSTGPDAINGWSELAAIASEADTILRCIETRERDADHAAEQSGAKVEAWLGRMDLAAGCNTQLSPRDVRIAKDALHELVDAGVFERLRAVRAADVFIADVDGRLSAPPKNAPGGIVNLGPMRQLAKATTEAMRTAVLEGDSASALERMEDLRVMTRAAWHQPGMMPWLIAVAMEDLARDAMLMAILSADGGSEPFFRGALEWTRQSSTWNADKAFEGNRLESLEFVDGIADRKRATIPGLVEMVVPLHGFDYSDARRGVEHAYAEGLVLRSRSWTEVNAARQAAKAAKATWSEEYFSSTDWALAFTHMAMLEKMSRLDGDGVRIVLGAWLFMLKYGSPPPSIDALVPEFLEAVPHDALAPDGRFRYIPGATMSDVIVYSVGLDAHDDGGVKHEKGPYEALYSHGAGFDFVIWPPDCGSAQKAE